MERYQKIEKVGEGKSELEESVLFFGELILLAQEYTEWFTKYKTSPIQTQSSH
jgi:hypothetical protein